MQIFLTTVNPGTYTFNDLGGYSITHPVGPIALIEPTGEFYEEDIYFSNDLLAEVSAGNITLTDSKGNELTNLSDLANLGDNLGNHKASVTLDLDSNDIANVTNITNNNITGIQVSAPDNFINLDVEDTVGNRNAGLSLLVEPIGRTTVVKSSLFVTSNSGTTINEISATNFSINLDFNSTSELRINDVAGFAGQVLTSSGPSARPTWSSIPTGVSELNDLSDVNTSITAINGSVLTWDTDNYVVNNTVLINQNGCSLQTVDDAGLDWCNFQIGSSGSSFHILKKALGTIAAPLPLTSGTKIGGIGFIGFDNFSSDPGYVNAEIASVVTEDQDDTSSGAELQFKVTANTTKSPITAFVIENDGTLTVRNQVSYELKVLSDTDIPNKKYVDDAIINNVSTSIGDLVDVDLLTLPQTQDGNLLKWSASNSSYVPSFFRERTNGVLAVDLITDYETLISNDDDVPNKKYVDDLFGGLTGAADMTALQLRRTTVHNISNGSFNSIVFDTADVENDSTVLEHNDSNQAQILIKETGIYLVTYDLHSDSGQLNKDFRILVNGTNTLEGSQSVRNESTDNNRATVGITLITNFSAGDFIELQTQASGGGAVLDPPSIFGVVRLKGSKGDSGDAGVAGNDGVNGAAGPMGFGMYAWSETDDDGTQLEGQDITVSTNAVGIYNYVFDNPAPSSNYGVFIQPVYAGTALNTVEKEVYNKTTTGFTIRLNQQDDGGSTGANVNFRHSVSVLGVGGGLPTGTITKGTAPDNEFVFFNGTTLNSNGSISYDTTVNNINIESQNTNASALNINTTTADADWLSFGYQDNYVGGFFGVNSDAGELGLILGDVGQQNTVIYQGTVNTAVGFQIANTPLSLFHLDDTAASTQNPTVGDVLRWNGTEWIQVSPPVTVFEPGMLRISSQGADQSSNYNVTTPSPIILTGPTLNVGLGSTYFSNSNGTITCNFDGVLRMQYHLPHFSNTSRSHLKTYIQKNGVTYGPAAYSYIRVGNGERRDDNIGTELIDVSSGDVIRVVAIRGETSTRTGAITLEANCTIILERVE